MTATAASRTRIVEHVSRWSQPRHGDARPDSDPAAISTAQSPSNVVAICAKASPRTTSVRHHPTATISRLAATVDAAIKSP
jgi:hypothetical protein